MKLKVWRRQHETILFPNKAKKFTDNKNGNCGRAMDPYVSKRHEINKTEIISQVKKYPARLIF